MTFTQFTLNSCIQSWSTLFLHGVCMLHAQICIYIFYPDTVPPIYVVSYHVATDNPPSQDGDKFWSILATIYNQSQLAERKHMARYWLITAATAVPLSAHPSAITLPLSQ